jgi:excisionase family DNA binding protein
MPELPTKPPDLLTKPIRDNAALLDVEQVAELLNCSARHVYRLADAGHMPPPVRLGTLVRWRRQDLDAWLAGGCRPVRTPGRA